MITKTSKIVPIFLSVLFIVIIIYLFATIRQPYIQCSRSVTDDLGIRIVEDLSVVLDANKIQEMELVKTIILPDNYDDKIDTYLDSIRFSLERSYDYLGKKVVSVSTGSDRVIVHIKVRDKETLILNNLEFFDDGALELKINPNTKSSGVVALRVTDSYTEGEFMKRMKNNGYACK